MNIAAGRQTRLTDAVVDEIGIKLTRKTLLTDAIRE